MSETANSDQGRTLMAAVLFADLVGYSKKPVTEQHAAKDAFRELVQLVLAPLPGDARALVDTGDGAAIAFLRDPEHALYAALRLRSVIEGDPTRGQLRPEELRIGINLGPVRRAIDVNGRPNLIGDGMNAAERVMSFAAPGHTTSSRSFRDAVSCLHGTYTGLFQPLGTRADKHGREHEIFGIGDSPLALEAATASLQVRDAAAPASAVAKPPKRNLIALATLAVAGIGTVLAAAALFTGQPTGDRAHPSLPSREPAPTEPAPAHQTAREPAAREDAPRAPSTEDSAPDSLRSIGASDVPTTGAVPIQPRIVARPPQGDAQVPRRAERKAPGGRCDLLLQKAGVGDLSRDEAQEMKASCR